LVLDEVGEGFVEVAGRLLEDAEGHFDVCVAESLDALATDFWIGVLSGNDTTGDACGDERVGAGWGAAVVAAGFEGYVGRSALRRATSSCGLLESDDLGVVAIVIEMCAFADDFWCATLLGCLGDDAAYLRVWGGEADGLGGELESPSHELFVVDVLGRVFQHHFLKIAVFIICVGWSFCCSLRAGSP
jgi:hypothetical protein